MKELDEHLAGAVAGGDGTSFGAGLCTAIITIGKFTLHGLFDTIPPMTSIASSLRMQNTLSAASDANRNKAGKLPEGGRIAPADQLYWMSYSW
jgi:hypothetical protein